MASFQEYSSQFQETFYKNICRYVNSMLSLELPLGLETNSVFKLRFSDMIKCTNSIPFGSPHSENIANEYLYDFMFAYFSPIIADYLYDYSKQELHDLMSQYEEYLERCSLLHRDTLEDENEESDG